MRQVARSHSSCILSFDLIGQHQNKRFYVTEIVWLLEFADAIFRRERSDDRKCVCCLQATQTWVVLLIGHLHNDVILLPRPESFSFFISYLHLVIPWGLNNKSAKSHKKAKPWRMLIVVAKWPIGWNKFPSPHDQSEAPHLGLVTRHQYGISALVPQTSFRVKPVVASQIVGFFLRPSSHFHLKPRTAKQIAHGQIRDQLWLQGILEPPTIFNSQAGLGYDFICRL